MSLISRLTTLGAAGSGGSAGFIAEFDDTTHTGKPSFQVLNADPNDGNIYFSGYAEGGDRLLFGSMDEDGVFQSARYIESSSNPSSSAALYGKSIAWDSTGKAYVGMYFYEPNIYGNDTSAIVKMSSSGVPTASGAKRLYNSNTRGGFGHVSTDSSDNIYIGYNGWTGSRQRGYIDKLATDLTFLRRDYVEDFQTTYMRDCKFHGTAVFLSQTQAIDQGSGRYGHGIYTKGASSQGIGLQRVFDNGGSNDNINSGEHGVLAFDSTYLYSGGSFDAATGTGGYNSAHVFSLNKSNGVVNWQKLWIEKVGSTYYQSECRSVCVDGDSNVYVTTSGKDNHSNILKYNSSGTLQWAYKIGTASSSRAFQMYNCMFYNGHLYVAANYVDGVDTADRACIVKLIPDGPSTGTYGDFVISEPTYDEPTNVPSSSSVTPESSDEAGMGSATWSTANGANNFTVTVENL